MLLLTEQLTVLLEMAFVQSGYEKIYGKVVLSNRLDLCQFQCNGAFAAAKHYKKAPQSIAQDVVAQLAFGEMIQTAEALPSGFININLSDDYLMQYTMEVYNDPHYGVPQVETPETIVLDYGNPNVAKPLHVGHLRSAIIGEALKRIITTTGRTAICDVHLGDWGLPMGLVLAELYERYGDTIPTLHVNTLNDIYPYASQKSKNDIAFLERARDLTAALQKGHPKHTAVWKQMVGISVNDIKETFSRLNVAFDYWYGESDSSQFVPELIQRLKAQSLLVTSEGAQVVEIAKPEDTAPFPPTIVIKSNGSEGYATTDLATLIQRQSDFTPNQIWYVVDFRQNLHFNQVFRTAYKSHLVPDETQLVHLCFGTVNGKDGKPFKTRDGGVMTLNALLDSAHQKAFENLREHDAISINAKHDTAEKIGIAAIKFGDLINHYSKDCLFDMEKFMASEGKTGVYLLYVIARINALLKKIEGSEIMPPMLNAIYTPSEKQLILKLALSGNAYVNAYQEKAPSILCENAYQIAVAFSRFYHDTHIVGEMDLTKKHTWITLCKITKAILSKQLNTLAIETVEWM